MGSKVVQQAGRGPGVGAKYVGRAGARVSSIEPRMPGRPHRDLTAAGQGNVRERGRGGVLDSQQQARGMSWGTTANSEKRTRWIYIWIHHTP